MYLLKTIMFGITMCSLTGIFNQRFRNINSHIQMLQLFIVITQYKGSDLDTKHLLKMFFTV